jgi:3-dehydroquinate synthetase
VLKKDKKREGNQIHFVLLDGIGDTIIEKVDLKELEDIVL